MNRKTRLDRTSLHLNAATAGLAGLIGMTIAELDVVPDMVGNWFAVVLIASVIVMFVTRSADEYVALLWQSDLGGFLALGAFILTHSWYRWRGTA